MRRICNPAGDTFRAWALVPGPNHTESLTRSGEAQIITEPVSGRGPAATTAKCPYTPAGTKQSRLLDCSRPRGLPRSRSACWGSSTDEGVRRNGGRVGAAKGPAALRRALAPLALHGPLAFGEVRITDCGDVVTEGEDLEAGQTAAAESTAAAPDAAGSQLSVVLGGGHETAWSSYRGLMASQHMQTGEGARPPRWGVLNLDAHFAASEFLAHLEHLVLQMAEAERAAGREPLNDAVRARRTRQHRGTVRPGAQPGCRMDDRRRVCRGRSSWGSPICRGVLRRPGLAPTSTIDLDVLPADVAPASSAPASMGVATPLVAAAVPRRSATGKLLLLDVVELNSFP